MIRREKILSASHGSDTDVVGHQGEILAHVGFVQYNRTSIGEA